MCCFARTFWSKRCRVLVKWLETGRSYRPVDCWAVSLVEIIATCLFYNHAGGSLFTFPHRVSFACLKPVLCRFLFAPTLQRQTSELSLFRLTAAEWGLSSPAESLFLFKCTVLLCLRVSVRLKHDKCRTKPFKPEQAKRFGESSLAPASVRVLIIGFCFVQMHCLPWHFVIQFQCDFAFIPRTLTHQWPQSSTRVDLSITAFPTFIVQRDISQES